MRKIWLLLTLALPLSVSAQKYSAPELARYKAEAQSVTVVRDNWGVPHIYSKTDAGVVFGLMYTQCEDNFKGIERNYLYQLGRQAEVDGDKSLYTDVQLQLIADSADAIHDYALSAPWFKKLMDAYADGINYYLYKHPDVKPAVFKKFKPWYALMFTDGSVAATETGGIRLEETKTFYDPATSTASVDFNKLTPIQDRELGSNGFAIAPSRTANGHAILYINPHVPFYFRQEVQLVSQEGLNVYGAVTWGQFFVYQGFNQHCGWMHTSSSADVADLYAEKVTKKDGHWFYEYNGQLKPVTERKLTINVMHNGELLHRTFTGYYTHHGPILGARDGKWLALKANNRSLDALLESWLITKANSFEQYKKVMGLLSNATNNTVYADDKGNIAFWYGNFMPKRDPKYDWSLPVDGTTDATEWKGLHPVNESIHVYNPSTGWIQNCNSTPYSCSGEASPDKQKYPAYMAPDGENYRAINARKLLTDAKRLTLDEVISSIGYDKYLAAFDDMIPALMKAYGEAPDSVKKNLEAPISVMYAWDKKSDANSVATTLAVEWGARVLAALPRPKTDEEGQYQVKRVQETLKRMPPAELLKMFAASVQTLKGRYGDWNIKWGDINRYQRPADGVTFSDSAPSIPVGTTGSPFGQLPSIQSRQMNTQKRYGFTGNSFIAAIEFGPKIKAKSIVTGGSSFDPKSPHYTDQAQMYLDGKFKDVLFYKAEVLKHAEKTYHPGM